MYKQKNFKIDFWISAPLNDIGQL